MTTESHRLARQTQASSGNARKTPSLRQLVRELEQAVSQLHSSSFRERAEQVVEFVRGCEGLHTYVIFIGD
jgi:hypothetical protein